MRWPNITGVRYSEPIQGVLALGAYQTRSLIAEAQRCVNLYPESNPPDAPFPKTHYPTPGLSVWAATPSSVTGQGRGLYYATNGQLFAALGQSIFYLNSAQQWTLVGSMKTSTGVVTMVDNGEVLLAADGSANLYVVDLSTHAFTILSGGQIYGATHVDYLDTFLIFNRPGTNQFYITSSNLNYIISAQGPIQTSTLTAGGSGYKDGVYSGQALVGGEGSGATATITVVSGVVTSYTLDTPGDKYRVNDVLSADLSSSSTPGPISSSGFSLSKQAYGIADGTYTGVALNGGSGSGATANITIQYGSVVSYALNAPGTAYAEGDLVTPNLPLSTSPGITLFQEPVFTVTQTTTSPGGSGLEITVNTLDSSNAINSLDIASKSGFPDEILALMVVHREIWLFGRQTTEVWVDTGAADFPFGREGGVFLQKGIIAPYSLAKNELTPLWLGQDQNGQTVVYQGSQYEAQRISTFAIEAEFQSYATVSDARGFVHQTGGHVFYVLNFPTADKTWAYDLMEGEWHERTRLDTNGVFHMHYPTAFANAYGLSLCQRYDTGDILQYDPTLYQDMGNDVVRIRSFPHIKNENRRILYPHFIADMEVGAPLVSTNQSTDSVVLRWSDTGGKTWGNGLTLPLTPGLFNNHLRWNRLGYGRDRVFELSWSCAQKTALNGAYISVIAGFS